MYIYIRREDAPRLRMGRWKTPMKGFSFPIVCSTSSFSPPSYVSRWCSMAKKPISRGNWVIVYTCMYMCSCMKGKGYPKLRMGCWKTPTKGIFPSPSYALPLLSLLRLAFFFLCWTSFSEKCVNTICTNVIPTNKEGRYWEIPFRGSWFVSVSKEPGLRTLSVRCSGIRDVGVN